MFEIGQQKNSYKDDDPIETKEWLDSLNAVLASSGVERAQYLLRVLGQAAQNKGIKGFVRLSFIIDINGKAKDIEVIRATSGFSRAAILAIERAEWIPAKRNGIPFEYRTSQNFNFDPKDIK